jgi:hypothetical protein
MPPQIGNFISQQVYSGDLKSNPDHPTKSSTVACRFVDINGAEQLDADGKSSMVSEAMESKENQVNCVIRTYKKSRPSRSSRSTSRRRASRIGLSHLTTRSGAQLSRRSRTVISIGTTSALMSIRSRVRSFNLRAYPDCSHPGYVETGNEDHVIVISVVRSKKIGFLSSLRRTNVMLTRCQRRMYIVSSRAFLEGKGADSLVGKMAAELGKRPGAWLSRKDIEDWNFE